MKEIQEIQTEQDVHFNKFIEEYCEVAPDNKCLKYDLFGAYRLWSRKLQVDSKTNLTKYMRKNYKTRVEFSTQHNTRLSYYVGLKAKEFIIKQEGEILPIYEEFILSEYKFGNTFRTSKKNIMDNFALWIPLNHPDYTFTKHEQTHMVSYLYRTFLNCPKIHINGGTEGYYGLQHKNDISEKNGILVSTRKQILQIDVNTQKILDTFGSLAIASEKLNIKYADLSECVISQTVIDSFFLKYNDLK